MFVCKAILWCSDDVYTFTFLRSIVWLRFVNLLLNSWLIEYERRRRPGRIQTALYFGRRLIFQGFFSHNIYFAFRRDAKYCDGCLLAYFKNHMSKLHEMFCTCHLLPWLDPPLTTMQNGMYFRFCGWSHRFHIMKPVRQNQRWHYALSSSPGAGTSRRLRRAQRRRSLLSPIVLFNFLVFEDG